MVILNCLLDQLRMEFLPPAHSGNRGEVIKVFVDKMLILEAHILYVFTLYPTPAVLHTDASRLPT